MASGPSVSKFHALSVRPPTPPKDFEDSNQAADEVLDFLQDPFGTKEPVAKTIVATTVLSTPQTSPAPENTLPSSTASSSRKKRVNFEPQSCPRPANGIAVAHSYIPTYSSPLRPLPQTRVSRPLKSILKPSDAASTPPVEGAPPHKHKSFADMLESITKQLASQHRSSRSDAYTTLKRTMEAYDEIPSTQALVDKMGLLTQFIQRDMQAVSINGTGLDSQLVSQSLRLLLALMRIPDTRPAMPEEFCVFLIERSIQMAADPGIPKTVVNTHLAVLMQQNFSRKIITTARVEKLLDALDTIQERVSGLSVLAYRIRIYRKLIQQRPDLMAKHAERWFKPTVKALLSTLKDINESAIDLTLCAAKAFGDNRQVTRSALAILNRQTSGGETYATVMVKELHRVLTTENAPIVPLIWSAVTSLLHGSLDKDVFPPLRAWLSLFDACFRIPNEEVKAHANVAFGFLVYAVSLNEKTAPGWRKMLATVPKAQLEKERGQGKKRGREAVMSSYYTLLYYSLGSATSQKQLDLYWAEFVAGFWRPLVNSSSAQNTSQRHATTACRIVSALFEGSRKPWDSLRALEGKQKLLQREELPLLDPKWVRKSLPLILEFVRTLLDASPWTAEDCQDEPAKTMWLSLLNSINSASSQEVMVSTESKDAMANIVNFLRRVWDEHAAQLAVSQQSEDSWAEKFCFLLQTAIEKLGATRFSEKCLICNDENKIEAAATPSHRSRQRVSPLLHFVDLVNKSEGIAKPIRIRALMLLIEPCYECQNDRLGRLEFLRDWLTRGVDTVAKSSIAMDFWFAIAEMTRDCLTSQPSDPKEHPSQQLGKEYEVVVGIISLGSPYLSKGQQGQELLTCLTETVRREAGEGAVVLAVVENLSERVLKRAGNEGKVVYLPILSILLRNLPSVIVRKTIEQGRQNLWPNSSNLGRHTDFDPYNHLYDAIVFIGSAGYHDLSMSEAARVCDFLAALGISIRQCSLSLLAVYLRRIQTMLRLWVEDPDRTLQQKSAWATDIYKQVVQLWEEVCAAIQRLPRRDGQILMHLEPTITAGFSSRRRHIVSISATSWNATFGQESRLRYPAQLEKVLRRLRTSVELLLPNIDTREDDDDFVPSFYDSDSNTEKPERRLQNPRLRESPFRISKASRKSRSKSRSPAVSGTNSKRATARQTPKIRLRHENSQMHFEPITSSPSNPFNQESQILTERQKEVIERQMRAGNLFADMRSGSPSQTQIHSDLELSSDVLSADDLPTDTSRTPLKTLPNLGPMDVFVGSSPTPQARNRHQEVMSDQTSLATPTAVRTVQLENDIDGLGSSPPKFEKNIAGNNRNADDLATNSLSFDEGITLEDITLPDAILEESIEDKPGQPHPTEAAGSDLPSSMLDLQLVAQFDADISARPYIVPSTEEQGISEAANRINTAPAQLNAKETSGEEVESPTPTEVDTSSISRVGDSFLGAVPEAESSRVHNLRRSGRHSMPNQQDANTKKNDPIPKRGRGRPRKSLLVDGMSPGSEGQSQTPAASNVVVPRTIQTRGTRRSASMLGQVGTGSRDVVDETPVPKRARRNTDKDVSESKARSGKAKRFVHAQVAAIQASEEVSSRGSSVAMDEDKVVDRATDSGTPAVGEQNANVAPQLPDAVAHASQTGKSQSQEASTRMATPSRSFAERVILTPRSIINQLRSLKEALFGSSQLVLGRQEEREIDDALFDIRREVHAAGRRGDNCD